MDDNTTAAATTTHLLSKCSTINNEKITDHDATNEEEDILYAIRIEGCIEEQADPESIPNNDFCFTEDKFLESITEMNDATRHHAVWHNALKEIHKLESE